MYVKQCFPALACALTLGFATGVYAQGTTTTSSVAKRTRSRQIAIARPHPIAARGRDQGSDAIPSFLLTPQQVFKTPRSGHVIGAVHVNPYGPRPAASSPLYQNIPTVIDPHDALGLYFRLQPPTAPLTVSALMDDFMLPAGMAGSTVSDVTLMVRNFGTAPQDVYGEITFWNDVVYTLNSDPSTHVVNQNSLGTTKFMIPGLVNGIRDFYNIPLGATPVMLTRDVLSTTDTNQYGLEVRFYDDAAHTIPSAFVTAQFPLNTADNPGVQLGASIDSFWLDESNVGSFEGGYYAFTGGSPHLGNLIMQINGQAANGPTYSVSGTLKFPSLTTSTANGATGPTLTFTFNSTTNTTAAPIVVTFVATLRDEAGSFDEVATYDIVGLAPDTYNLTISSPGFIPVSVPSLTFVYTNTHVTPNTPFNHNVYNLNETLNAGGAETVTGNIALEGVNDLSATNVAAPLGSLTVGFYTPGSVVHGAMPPITPLYTQTVTLTPTPMSINGAYTVTGVPDGTYDVVIKGAKNLAVQTSNVVISSTSTTIPSVVLPAGDSNNDDSVDSTDFGNLIGVFNTSAASTGSGYDPTADFNFDGAVDSTDFGLLIGNFNTVGPL